MTSSSKAALVEVDGGKEGNTPLIEAVSVLVGCHVQVNSEEDVRAGGVQVHRQRDLVGLGDFPADPVECHHGQVRHDGVGQLQGITHTHGSLQLQSCKARGCMVKSTYCSFKQMYKMDWYDGESERDLLMHLGGMCQWGL